MRLLVCGSRTWRDWPSVRHHLSTLWSSDGKSLCVIHGGAEGADKIAGAIALHELESTVMPFPADWQRDGKAAGPIRNARMLRDGKPDRGLAFGALWRRARHGEAARWYRTGTGDMVSKMIGSCLPVRWVASPDAPAVELREMPRPGAM